MFNKWVDPIWQERANTENFVSSLNNPAKNAVYTEWKFHKAGYYEEGFQSAGYFHTWAQQTDILDNGQVEHYVQAIVENSQGLIFHIPSKHIQFVELPTPPNEYYIGHLTTGEAVVIPYRGNQVDEAKEYGIGERGKMEWPDNEKSNLSYTIKTADGNSINLEDG